MLHPHLGIFTNSRERESRHTTFFYVPQKSENECFCLSVASMFSLLHQGKKRKQHKRQEKNTELFWWSLCSKSQWNFFLISNSIQSLLTHAYLVPSSSVFMFWSNYSSNIFEYLACAKHWVMCCIFRDEPHVLILKDPGTLEDWHINSQR